MSARFVIDGLDFVRNAGALRGKIAIAELERLQDYLADNRGELEYAVSGVVSGDGKPVLQIAVTGAIILRCQRCLDELAHALDLQTNLLLAKNESELSRFDEDESADAVLATPDMDVLALIEDEIILGMPIAPRHPEGACSAGEPTEGNEADRKNPFAALAALKKLH